MTMLQEDTTPKGLAITDVDTLSFRSVPPSHLIEEA